MNPRCTWKADVTRYGWECVTHNALRIGPRLILAQPCTERERTRTPLQQRRQRRALKRSLRNSL